MNLQDRHITAIRKKAKRRTGRYPAATVAFYGPNADVATKVAVGVILAEGEDVAELERWYSSGLDIRKNGQAMSEILEFLRKNSVKDVLMMETILGCPHEEGKDYPEGDSCPQCLFWKGRDRWTGKLMQ